MNAGTVPKKETPLYPVKSHTGTSDSLEHSLDSAESSESLSRRNSEVSDLPSEIDFSELTDTGLSVPISKTAEPKPGTTARIKASSYFLPVENSTCSSHAFKNGLKDRLGIAFLHNLGKSVKEIVGILPESKTGKLAERYTQVRNESRNLYELLLQQKEQLLRISEDQLLSAPTRTEASFLAYYFLELTQIKLQDSLDQQKLYSGLLKANVGVDTLGRVVRQKDRPSDDHPYHQSREADRKNEYELLSQAAYDPTLLPFARSHLNEREKTYENWKSENDLPIRQALQRAHAAGQITGEIAFGLISTSTYLGAGIATLNPVLFAGAGYQALSTSVRVGEIAAKTHLANRALSLHAKARPDAQDSESLEVERQKIQKGLKIQDGVKRIHDGIDVLANTSFNLAGVVTGLPTAQSAATATSPSAGIGSGNGLLSNGTFRTLRTVTNLTPTSSGISPKAAQTQISPK